MQPSFKNQRVLIGVTGGIAAYKTAELVRLLVQQGALVRVVMTDAACQFITPLTLQALSGNPVSVALLDPNAEAGMGHIELARWAQWVLIAPASAHTMARLAHGFADDLLTTLYLATRAPVYLAPAMNQHMWQHPSTQANAEILRHHDVTLLGPALGEQACGDNGPGRMLEPSEILQRCLMSQHAPILQGKTLLITAGPTREAIDPVRYISNHSSGKMGFALAAAGIALGARVIVVAGPVSLSTPVGVERVDVISAQQMFDTVQKTVVDADIFIGCAAVSDFQASHIEAEKIKKQAQNTPTAQLSLKQTPDILAWVAQSVPRPFTVGFAAETEQVIPYAMQKLQTKNLDLVVANNVSQSGIGFDSDDNCVTLVHQGEPIELPKQSKVALAHQLMQHIAQQLPTLV